MRTDTVNMSIGRSNSLTTPHGVQPSLAQRWLIWFVESRSHRVICLVACIWVLNAFDLALTILAHEQGLLVESNPVGRRMLDYGIVSLVLYKIGMVLVGSYPLLRFRRARITELGSLVVLIAYVSLAMHWTACYDLYAMTASGDIDMAELHRVGAVP